MLKYISLSTLAKTVTTLAVAWVVCWVVVFKAGLRPLDWVVNAALDGNTTFMGLMAFVVCLGPVFVKILAVPFQK